MKSEANGALEGFLGLTCIILSEPTFLDYQK